MLGNPKDGKLLTENVINLTVENKLMLKAYNLTPGIYLRS